MPIIIYLLLFEDQPVETLLDQGITNRWLWWKSMMLHSIHPIWKIAIYYFLNVYWHSLHYIHNDSLPGMGL